MITTQEIQNIWGFQSLKDYLQVLFVPIALFGLGAWLPRMFDRRKRNTFERLIIRELKEMEPVKPESRTEEIVWPDYLKKRFVHEEIFRKPSENRDFILSLDPDLAYYMTQLWNHFDKEVRIRHKEDEKTKKENLTPEELREMCEHAVEWCIKLFQVIYHLKPQDIELNQMYTRWEEVTIQHHDEAKERIEKAKKDIQTLAKL